MDFEQARFNMIEQQIRPWDVLDPAVLALLATVKREDFVGDAYRSLAFADTELPLGHGQSMMAPRLEARLIQELALKSNDKVLEIGTGSGYLAALLGSMVRTVTSIEIYPDFSQAAKQHLTQAGIHNVRLLVGDAMTDLSRLLAADEKFDAIVLTGSVPILPLTLLDWLTPEGRLFAVIGDAPAMKATLISKTGDKTSQARELFETVLTPLIHAPRPSRFRF
ncbi:MAG: protein-L-isoaspartate O-methyltransferase [Betaproteobacteria bacterium]|nr:protein-L-isoaspartate O-methyltransferase [Betaproteobacteria bacterium]